MKETTALNKTSNILEDIDYKSVYIEIQTKDNKYTLEKNKELKIIGFRK